MSEPAITPELIQQHNLSEEEYQLILEQLGREPNLTELGIFSVMWSEHCSYKNTRPLLKGFPTRSSKVLVPAGEENAGVIDIGDGLAIAFKIESHNTPVLSNPSKVLQRVLEASFVIFSPWGLVRSAPSIPFVLAV